MRKNFGNDMGCFGIAIMLILTAICPPLVIIYLVIYAFIYDNIGFDNFFTALQVIGLALVLILSPVVTMGSIFTFGFEETWKESALLVVITLLEIIGLMIFIITSYKTNVARKNETPEERNKRMEEEKLKRKEKEKQLKEYRLNKPFDRNEKHVIALGLYDQLLDSSKLRYQQEIKNLVSQNANLSRSTWEVYYHRILVREPSPQELQDIYYKKWSEISDKWGLSFDKRDEEISLFKKDWNKDWLSAAIKWNIDLGRYNWMKKSPEYPRIDLGELPNYNEIDKAEEIDVTNSEKVYLTPVRKKYHKRTCTHIKNRDDLIEITIDEAVKEGCVACKICFK